VYRLARQYRVYRRWRSSNANLAASPSANRMPT
jgi:hypothetical protein